MNLDHAEQRALAAQVRGSLVVGRFALDEARQTGSGQDMELASAMHQHTLRLLHSRRVRELFTVDELEAMTGKVLR